MEGPFICIGFINEGASALVYKITNEENNEIFALKFPKPLKRQKEEAKISIPLDHPNIIKTYKEISLLSKPYINMPLDMDLSLDFINHKTPFDAILMEYCPDGPLNNIMKSRLDIELIKDYGNQIAIALKYLKDKEIIHGDLKPENILISGKTLKLCDFGGSLYSSKSHKKQSGGTPIYTAPEVLKRDILTYHTDTWSLGIILYRMSEVVFPYDAENYIEFLRVLDTTTHAFKFTSDDNLKDVINGLLIKRSWSERKPVEWVLSHPFFKTTEKVEIVSE